MKQLRHLPVRQAGFWGAIAGGIASFIGGERRNEAQANSAKDVNEFNARQAELDREFQSHEAGVARNFNKREARWQAGYQTRSQQRAMSYEADMSNTAVRRRMRDLRAGGINPILAGRYDASTPSASATSGAAGSAHAPAGATASGQQARIEDSISPSVHSALDTIRTKAAANLAKEEAKASIENQAVLKQQAGHVQAQTGVANAQATNISADTNIKRAQEHEVNARIQEINTNTALKQSQAALNEANTEHTIRQWDTPETQRELNRAHSAQSAATTALEKQRHYADTLDNPRRETESRIASHPAGQTLQILGKLGPAANSALAAGTLVGIGKKIAKFMRR